jgi:anti-sigma factor RsiW
MTDCPNGEIRDLLPDLVHDRLTPDVRIEVEAHVSACGDCSEELALLRAMRASLRRAPAVNVGAIAAAIPAYRAPVRPSWGGWRAAAAIVILAVGGTSVAVLQRDTLTSARPAAVTAPRELALGTSAVTDLDDGELSTLLEDLPTLDVLPAADVEPAAVSPVSPTGTE